MREYLHEKNTNDETKYELYAIIVNLPKYINIATLWTNDCRTLYSLYTKCKQLVLL